MLCTQVAHSDFVLTGQLNRKKDMCCCGWIPGVATTGGPPGPDPLRRLPPPPSLPGFGPEVPDHGRRRRPKEILLDLVEGEKLGFCPMCLYSKYSVFLGEPNSG